MLGQIGMWWLTDFTQAHIDLHSNKRICLISPAGIMSSELHRLSCTQKYRRPWRKHKSSAEILLTHYTVCHTRGSCLWTLIPPFKEGPKANALPEVRSHCHPLHTGIQTPSGDLWHFHNCFKMGVNVSLHWHKYVVEIMLRETAAINGSILTNAHWLQKLTFRCGIWYREGEYIEYFSCY